MIKCKEETVYDSRVRLNHFLGCYVHILELSYNCIIKATNGAFVVGGYGEHRAITVKLLFFVDP